MSVTKAQCLVPNPVTTPSVTAIVFRARNRRLMMRALFDVIRGLEGRKVWNV